MLDGRFIARLYQGSHAFVELPGRAACLESQNDRKNMALSPFSSWNKTAAVALLIVIWFVWGMKFVTPQVTDDVLSKLNMGSGSAAKTAGDLRPLVLYTYAESENARANFKFFIRNGLHGQADFVFIFNGETDAPDLLPADLPNVKIVRRENKCFDIGAHGEVLRQDDLWKKYKRFITMNASIRGPFVPTYYPSCWMDAFLGKITDKVKVGRTKGMPEEQKFRCASDDDDR